MDKKILMYHKSKYFIILAASCYYTAVSLCLTLKFTTSNIN